MHLPCTELNYERQSILKKFRILRKIDLNLDFNLYYYPYWIVRLQGSVQPRWLPKHFFEESRAVDSYAGRIYKMMSLPEYNLKKIDENDQLRVASVEISLDTASAIAEADILKKWNKKYRNVLRLNMNLNTENIEIFDIYRPFWIISRVESEFENEFMVVDGTTGLSGLSEFQWVLKSWVERSSLN